MNRKTHISQSSSPKGAKHILPLLLMMMVMLNALRVAGQMIPDTVCVGETKHYWVTPNPIPGSTYTWTINNVVQPSTTNEIFVTWDLPYSPAGSPYTISVQEKSAAGCYGAVRSGLVYLNSYAPVAITITPSQNPVCSGIPVTFTATVTNGGPAPAYSWIVNGNATGTTTSTYTYQPNAGDQVSCIVNSNAACATNNPATSIPVVMLIGTVPTVTFTPCFEIITSVESRPFRLKGGIPLNGTYSGGAWVNNPTPGMFNPQVAPTGSVPVTYTYTNAAGCTASSQILIQNYPSQAPGFTCGNSNWVDIRDNKIYPTVRLGSQCWLGANLNYGNAIPYTQTQDNNCVTEKYCYNNQAANCNGSNGAGLQNGPGGLYQWDELMQYNNNPALQDICPPGWHVPTDPEWNQLFAFYGGNAFAGAILQDLTMVPGFHALPTGVVYQNNAWSFKGLATICWSSTTSGPMKAISHGMNNISPSVSLYESLRNNALPVRCLRNP